MTSQSVEEWVRAEQDLRGVIGRLEATVEHLQQVRVTQGVRSDQRRNGHDVVAAMSLCAYMCCRHTSSPTRTTTSFSPVSADHRYDLS